MVGAQEDVADSPRAGLSGTGISKSWFGLRPEWQTIEIALSSMPPRAISGHSSTGAVNWKKIIWPEELHGATFETYRSLVAENLVWEPGSWAWSSETLATRPPGPTC